MQIEQKIKLVESWGFKPVTNGMYTVTGAYERKIENLSIAGLKVIEVWTTQDSDYINIYVSGKFTDDFKIRWSDFEEKAA